MTVNNFTASVSGDFATASNWSLGHVPNDTEDAEIDPANGDFAVESNTELVNSIGTFPNDGLIIDDGASLTAFSGTGPDANDGSISIVDADLFLGSGTFDNVGTVALEGVEASDVGTFDVEGSITLNGGGNIEAAIVPEGRASDNVIGGFNFSTTPTLVNVNNTISGDVTIGGLNFTNQADGLIETNNGSSSGGGSIAIQGSAGGGSFTNNGSMIVNSGGQFVFGIDNRSTTIDNEGSIFFQADNQFTRLALSTGSVTISASGLGRIEMFGQTPSDDQIEDLGQPTSLNLINQVLDGAGEIGIGDNTLTLNLESGAIEADSENQDLLINTGSNSITDGGTFQAIQGGELVIDSPITNSGTINVSGDGSIVELFGAVSGSGSIDVGSGGVLDLNASVTGNFSFTGVNAVIKLGSGGSLHGAIAGAEGTDQIDLATVAFASGDQAVWQQNGGMGTLSLINGGGGTLAAFTLSGQYSSADFSALDDGSGGTLLKVLNQPPPAGTTADMIIRDTAGDYDIFDIGGNAIVASYALTQIAMAWQVVGLGGFNGADTSDMMLRNSATGAFQIDDVSSNSIDNAVAMGQVGLEWAVVGFGDFSSQPGETDMLIRNTNTGAFELFDIGNNQITSAAPMGQVGLEWSVAGFGDFSTQPNETDMLMRNNNTGAFELFDIRNNQITSAASMGQVGLEWSVAGFGDFSGNANETDMLMRNNNTGVFEVFDISNNQITSAAPMGQVGGEWRVVGFGPFNGASNSDMLMRNTNTGVFEVFDITNNQITAAAAMGQVGDEWQVAGVAADPPSGPAAASDHLVQAMASFASDAGAPDNSAPLGQAAAQSSVSNLFTVSGAQAHPA